MFNDDDDNDDDDEFLVAFRWTVRCTVLEI